MGAMMKGSHTGIAISATELVFTRGDGANDAIRVSLGRGPTEQGSWPELAAAFQSVGASATASHSIALLPPLIDTKRLDLPPLDETALIQLIARNAGKYFVGARGTQLVGVLQHRASRGEPALVVGSSVASRVIALIGNSARDHGVRLNGFVPAEGAWAAAADKFWPAHAKRASQVLVMETDRTVLLDLRAGRLAGVRRFRAGALDAELIASAIDASPEGQANVGVFGTVSSRSDLLRALAPRGINARSANAPWADFADQPMLVAAAFASQAAGPRLMTDEARTTWRATVQRRAIGIGVAAVVLLAAAAALNLWGVRRELASVHAQREALRPQVSATLVGRSTVEEAYRKLSALAAAQRSAPHWAAVLSAISPQLPDDAFLTAFHTRADSLVLDGMAARASRVFDAIHDSPLLISVRAPGQVRRQAPEGGDPLERFTIAATLKSKDTIAVVAPAPKPAGKSAGAP